ncbi:MAG TPA: CDP-alcohol phosphatidyltransferase family protein [Myxococcota bacterium]|nr:CDP-alcohol phosphatidyltransferase family protein [Myxococcota bacterium]
MSSSPPEGAVPAAPRVRVWIDATRPQSGLVVFGMSLVERHLRGLVQAGIAAEEIRIELPAAASPEASVAAHALVPATFAATLPIRWSHEGGPPRERLERALADAHGALVLALDGDAIVDARLLAHLEKRGAALVATDPTPECGAPTAVLSLAAPLGVAIKGERLVEIAASAVEQGALARLSVAELDTYLQRLRRSLPPYLFVVRDAADRDAAERFLFWSNYKGSTDFFTRYVYPPLVWRALRPLTRWRVHPNVITLFNVVITLAAVPLFAKGWWVSGFACAWGMSVLDSVDGKLARLQFKSSELGHNLDHGLDLIHPPLWYFAWAYALSGGDLGSPLFHASIWMAAFYAGDRIVTRLFTWRTGRSIHAFTPLDVRMRTVISRRNINLPLFTIGLPLGLGRETFALIVAWQIATFAFHALRLAQCWNRREARGTGGAAQDD